MIQDPLYNRRDEEHARFRRAVLGRRQWLVSWEERGDGRWLARVSCPQLPMTIERSGNTRCEAIRFATEFLEDLVPPKDLETGRYQAI